MGGMTRLAHLDLRGCTEITDEGLHQLGNLTTLTRLELHAGRCTDEGLNSLGSLTRLKYLNITAGGITDDGLRCLSRMQELHTFMMQGAQSFTGSGFFFIADLGMLQNLVLKDCGNISEKGMECLTGMTSLAYLAFKNSSTLTDVCLQYLTNMGSLYALSLYMYGCECEHITSKGLQYVGCCTALTVLMLDDCSGISAGFQHLDRLVFLSTLSLDNCGITNDGVLLLSELASLKTSLTDLSLSRCVHITGACLVHLKNFQLLSSLNLHGCNISTAELGCLQGMPVFQTYM